MRSGDFALEATPEPPLTWEKATRMSKNDGTLAVSSLLRLG